MPLVHIKPVVCYALLAVNIAALAAIHLFWPGLRFENGALNYASFIVLHISLPLLFVLLALSTPGKSLRVTAFILVAVTSVPTGLLSFAAIGQLSAALSAQKDPHLNPVAELKYEKFTYRLYRTSYNPYKAHGLLLRKEHTLMPGVKFVSDVKGFYGTMDGELKAIAGGRARVTTKPYSSQVKAQIYEFNL